MEKCKACDAKRVSTHRDTETIQYKGSDLPIRIFYSKCGNCEDEFISSEQIIQNDALVREAKKAFDGLMSSSELKAAREALHLTQLRAAEIFGGGVNAFSRYERGEISQSKALDILIRACVRWDQVFQFAVTESVNVTSGTIVKKVGTEKATWAFHAAIANAPSDSHRRIKTTTKSTKDSWAKLLVTQFDSDHGDNEMNKEMANAH